MKTQRATRSLYWATIIYPESAPNEFIEILSDLKIPILISPLHEYDIDPYGEVKKEHYHIIFCFDSLKTEKQVLEIIEIVNGVGIELVRSIRSYARYLCHLDNADKYKYDIIDVIELSGADYYEYCSLISDKYKAIGEMIDYCQENNVIMYSDLLEYSRLYRYEWFKILCDSGTVVIKEYLRSREYRNKVNG